MRHLFGGVETVKRFVKVYFTATVSNLKEIRKKSTLPPPWKNICGRPWCCVHAYHEQVGIFQWIKEESHYAGTLLVHKKIFSQQRIKQ